GAPKEQPPRNLSGPRTARAGHSGKWAFAPHRRGKPYRVQAAPSTRPAKLSGSMTEGEPRAARQARRPAREAPMTPSDSTGFAARHIGPSADEQAKMLAVVGQ